MERGEDIHAGNDAHSELNVVEGNGKDISAGDSAAAAAAVTGNARAAAAVREHDQYMPIANVVRIMRRILPPNAKISDDAKEKIQECVTEYISFVTGEANDRCRREQRKTVTADDILWAMGTLGFDDYVEPLTVFLNRYREIECGRTPARIVPQPQPAVLPPYMEPPALHHMGPAGAFDGGFGGYDGMEWPAGGGAAASSSSSDAAVFNNFDPYAQLRY